MVESGQQLGRKTKVSDRQYVGQLLERARRAAGVSIEEAAVEVQLSPRHVRALEAGNFSEFAAEVYARGACERYARYLGVDSNRLERAWQRALKEERVERPLRLLTPATLLDRLLTPRLVLAAASVFLAVLVGGYVIWQVQSFWRLPRLEVTGPKEGLVTDAFVQLEGEVEKQVQVRVNGESVLLSADGTFTVPIWLHPGVNVLRVEASSLAGRVARVEKHIVRAKE